MALLADIAAIQADGTRTGRRQQLDVYDLKVAALRDALVNGKPAPSPIPPVVGRTFTLAGATIHVNAASAVRRTGADGQEVSALYIDVTVTRGGSTATHQVTYVNPPV